MPKYTKEFKEKVILEYLSGKAGGCIKVANKYDIHVSTLENWIRKYKEESLSGLERKIGRHKKEIGKTDNTHKHLQYT